MMGLYLFWGQEEYLLEKEISELKENLINPDFASMSYKVLGAPKFMELVDIIRSQPLMFGNSLFVIDCEKYFFDIKDRINFEDKELDEIENALKNISNGLNIVFRLKIARDENKKIDTRRKLYKILAKYCEIKEFAQFRSYDKALVSWIGAKAKKIGLNISTEAANFLISQVGVNLRQLDNELEKLELAVYPEKIVKIEDIKNNCSSTQDVFLLADYFVLGQKQEAMLEFERLCLKKHPTLIVAALQSSFQKFIELKIDSQTLSAYDISVKTRLPEFIVKKNLEKLAKVSYLRLIEMKKNLTSAEFKIKTGKLSNPNMAIEMALLG